MQGTQVRKPLARGSLTDRLQGTEPFAYFADFFAVCFFGGLDGTVFPGGTHPHPQFSFLANGITSFPTGYRLFFAFACRARRHPQMHCLAKSRGRRYSWKVFSASLTIRCWSFFLPS